jgi:dTDP-4-amino-4,6-dideoxygalactose transaminase
MLAVNGATPVVDAAAHRPWPEIRPEDKAAIMTVLERGILHGAQAPEIVGLEHDWAHYLGVSHCLALNSGTAALHSAMAAIGVEPGEEVIVPAFTFIATPHAVAHQGGVPVFCDIDPVSYNISPAAIEACITPRTRALMPVHMHGLPADMDEIMAIATRHGLEVIEDACQAHGATYRGRLAGTIAPCAAFSLNGSKNLPGGEGGLFVTEDPAYFHTARRLSEFGEDVEEDLPPADLGASRSYWSYGLGWNYRTQELSAAMARSQLRRLDEYNVIAQRNAAILTEGLGSIPGLVPPHVPADRTSVYHKYRIRLDAEAVGYSGPITELRDRVLFALRAEGVEAVVWQLDALPAYPAFRRGPLRPWHPRDDKQPLEPWDRGAFPEAAALLDCSIVIGSMQYPIYIQDASLMERYVEAAAKVMADLGAVLAAPRPGSEG